MIPPELEPEYRADLQCLFNGSRIWNKEVVCLRKDGQRIEVCLWAAPIQPESGPILRIAAIIEDITGRKENKQKLRCLPDHREEIEARLRENEQRMRLAFQAAKVGYWDWDLLTGEQIWSLTAKQQMGFAEDASLSFEMSLNSIHPHDRQMVRDAMENAIRSGTHYRLDFRSIWPDGSIHYRLAKGCTFYDAGNNPTRMTGIVLDMDEIRNAEESLKLRAAALQAAANGIVITDRNGSILWANNAFSELTGFSSQEVIGKNPRLLKSGKHEAAFYQQLWKTICAGHIWRGEITNRRKDGSNYCEEMIITPVRSTEGEITHFIAIKQDISERKRSECALREAEAKYRAMFEESLVGIYQCAPDGKLLRVNRALAQLHGYESAEELLAANLDIHTPLLTNDPATLEKLKRTADQGSASHRAELQVRCKDGSSKWIEISSRAVRDNSGNIQMYEGIVQDITDRKTAEAQVRFLALYDALTGLPNRTLFLDRANIALATARRTGDKVALLYVDLDRFKNVNDSLGHETGNVLLQQAAERLSSSVRDEDTVTRLSGDEFLILLTSVSSASAALTLAERVRNTVAKGLVVHEHGLNLTCTIGVSIFPDHGSEIEGLIKHADIAMNGAKERGRNLVMLFDESMNIRLIEHIKLENELRHALERQQMFLVFQPQVNSKTTEIVASEALLRWQHPELGMVAPDRFIPVAEATGLIVPIGNWVLKTACAQLGQWQEQGLDLPVAVNVSGLQLRHNNFLEFVKSTLAETRVSPDLLELELTESVLVSKGEDILGLLKSLACMGIRVAIDDFGTGYSNLSYLKHFPIHKLKIDRSFVRDLAHDREDAAITETIIAMAKILKLTSVAEAVETPEQLFFLRKCGCDVMQGYYFYRPLPAREYAEIVHAQVMLSLAPELPEFTASAQLATGESSSGQRHIIASVPYAPSQTTATSAPELVGSRH